MVAGSCCSSIRTFRICLSQNWKTTRNQFGWKCLQTKLLILWQVGIDRLVALVKNSNHLENSLITLGLIIRGKKLPSAHVLGDFNFKDIDWPDRLSKSGSTLSQSEGQILIDIMNDHGLEQMVHFPTREKMSIKGNEILPIFEPPHDKTNKMECVPSEDSDQPGHPPSLIRVFAIRMKKAWVCSYPLSPSKDLDQTGRMPRLIWVFAGCSHFVGFVMRWLKFYTIFCLVKAWESHLNP